MITSREVDAPPDDKRQVWWDDALASVGDTVAV
jgi:hypothetical protein